MAVLNRKKKNSKISKSLKNSKVTKGSRRRKIATGSKKSKLGRGESIKKRIKLHDLPKWLESFEHFNSRLIPIAVILLAVIIAVELFGNLHSHFWEEVIHIIDLAIIGIFVIDLVFIFYHVRHFAVFFRRFWLDILAVFPFVFIFRMFGSIFRFFRLGEQALFGQTILHEGLEVRKATAAAARSQKFAKYVRLGARSIRVVTKSRFFTAFKHVKRRKQVSKKR